MQAKLTKLSKSKSLFDDPAAEISELSYVITQDINRLNEDLEELSAIHDLENTPNAQSNEHARSVKKALQSNLKGTLASPACNVFVPGGARAQEPPAVVIARKHGRDGVTPC